MTALAEFGFDLVLCGMIAAAAALAVGARDRFAAVVFFIVYGVFASLGWLRLGAVDVALAEVALGAGLTGLLLLGANARLPDSRSLSAHTATRLVAVALGASVTLGLGWAFLALPEPAGLEATVAANLDEAGADNPVTAVLLNFRGWDTLLESIVLLTALIGVWAASADDAWGRRPGLKQHARSGGVLANFGRMLLPVGLTVGVYLVWAGSSQPGGAFQGGTVLAAVALLVLMGGLVRPPPVVSRRLRLALIAGPAIFLGVGVAGAASGVFLWLPAEIAKPLILGIESVLTLSIATTLALLVIGPPQTGEAQE